MRSVDNECGFVEKTTPVEVFIAATAAATTAGISQTCNIGRPSEKTCAASSSGPSSQHIHIRERPHPRRRCALWTFCHDIPSQMGGHAWDWCSHNLRLPIGIFTCLTSSIVLVGGSRYAISKKIRSIAVKGSLTVEMPQRSKMHLAGTIGWFDA